MKFTKEDALEKLKAILTNNGKKPLRMSEISFNRQLETLMPLIANDETELDDFVEKVKVSFETMNSNAEKDNSTFIEQWKKDHPEKKTETKKEKEEKVEGNGQFEELMKRFEELENRFQSNEKEKAINTKRTDLDDAMARKGIKDKAWRTEMLNNISFDEETDVESKADSLLKIYNLTMADTGGQKTPLGTSSGKSNDSDRFDYIKKQYEMEHKREEV